MSSETKQILTTDGIPLEVSLKKAEKKNKIKAFLLVAPLLLFLVITYVFPIGEMFSRSIDDKMITNMLPKTFKEMEKWDGQELPPEEVFEGFYLDYKKLVESLKSDGFEMMVDLTVVDWFRKKEPRFEIIVQLLSTIHNARKTIKVFVNDEDLTIPSITDIYPSANFYEREAYDMFGIIFADHPDLTRILMPDDWQGYPLRKNYGSGRIPVQFKNAPKVD